jgi:hypothetical protein
MRKFVVALLTLLAGLPLAAQDAEAQKKFAGTWEAKFKDKVICTIRVRAGEQISGETDACSISVDENGDLKEPDPSQHPDKPSPMLNAKIQGDILTFEDKDDDDVLKFEMKLMGEGKAELRILETPMLIKPIHFERKKQGTVSLCGLTGCFPSCCCSRFTGA